MNQWAKVLLASAIVSVSVGVNADTVNDNIFNCNQEIKKGNLEKALDISQLLIKQNPKLADGWACQGKALFSLIIGLRYRNSEAYSTSTLMRARSSKRYSPTRQACQDVPQATITIRCA